MKQNQIESQEKPSFKWYHIPMLLLVWGFFYTLIIGLLFGFKSSDWEKGKLMISKEKIIALILLVFFTHFLDSIGIWEQSKKWQERAENKLAEKELETKQIIEEMRKELLETKTELLLTQNKLREEQEKKLITNQES